jgi:hypothetical protein
MFPPSPSASHPWRLLALGADSRVPPRRRGVTHSGLLSAHTSRRNAKIPMVASAAISSPHVISADSRCITHVPSTRQVGPGWWPRSAENRWRAKPRRRRRRMTPTVWRLMVGKSDAAARQAFGIQENSGLYERGDDGHAVAPMLRTGHRNGPPPCRQTAIAHGSNRTGACLLLDISAQIQTSDLAAGGDSCPHWKTSAGAWHGPAFPGRWGRR